MSTKKATLILFGIIFAMVLFFVFKEEKTDFSEKYATATNLESEISNLGRENTYSQYIETFGQAQIAVEDVLLTVDQFQELRVGNESAKIVEDENGKQGVYCPEGSEIEWKVQVPEAGLYQIQLAYLAVSSRGADLERKLKINGTIPFVGADSIIFNRVWKDDGESTFDNQGNEIKASQIDEPMWMDSYVKDSLGYFAEPYYFFFEKGTNTLAFEAVNEPMIISGISLKAGTKELSYSDYVKLHAGETSDEKVKTTQLVIEGESAKYRSSPSLYPVYDRSAPNTSPYSVTQIVLNMIGGNAWRVPGQWIEWEFQVPGDGFYNVTFKARQNYNRGFVSNRMITIDGKVPFSEMAATQFDYNNDWRNVTLGDEEGTPYNLYLTEGTHTLRMEVTLGELGDIVSDLQDSVYRLNTIYRKILVLTGATPDAYRDYQIEKVYPEVIEAMDLESKRLYRGIDRIVAYSGQKASQVAAAQTLAEQLERFVENPYMIPKAFQTFKDNISALGTSTRVLSEAPLDIDLLTITGTDAKPARVSTNFIAKTVHEVRSFVASFTNDYNSIGNVYSSNDSLEVWVLTGRDQSAILKSMIDDDFTPNTGINVNLKLVEAGTLLNAVVAGKGPDVVLSTQQGEPVNYALRNAVEDLTQFKDYQEVLKSFTKSAYTPYWFEGGLYALPETQNFDVLFYRKDILEELGLSVPQTWDDLIEMLPTIQQENLSVAIPSTERIIANMANPDISALLSINYQLGGNLYNEDGTASVLDSTSGVSAFETYTDFFNKYGLPLTYDFPNRFRSGEMPIGIQDYTMYNTLVVFAPEIRGLWDFTLMPGTLKEDGSIDRSDQTWGTNCMLLKQSDQQVKNNGWEFMKWWVSADSQAKFGMEMESVMGASARYATANLEAFKQLTWSKEQVEVLDAQRAQTVGQMEIAGGYYTPRHITNAVRKVINQHEDAREVLLDYVITINEEIEKKRLEFGLEVD